MSPSPCSTHPNSWTSHPNSPPPTHSPPPRLTDTLSPRVPHSHTITCLSAPRNHIREQPHLPAAGGREGVLTAGLETPVGPHHARLEPPGARAGLRNPPSPRPARLGTGSVHLLGKFGERLSAQPDLWAGSCWTGDWFFVRALWRFLVAKKTSAVEEVLCGAGDVAGD